ncbi:MAG: B-box zinc finger protein [Chloroflexi bacterium]|nr:B-box zinc finger protein [Chloroflexota bacterium]MBI3734055.1 B-box zinc finger protein [Chloroflexota bacterium]
MTDPAPSPTLTPPSAPATLYCANHPDRETLLRCGRCGKPICRQCQVRHPVGLRCRECAQIRKDPIYSLTPTNYALAFASALAAGTLGGLIAPFLGFFFAFFVGPVIGGAIAEFVGRVIGYKRGRPLQIIVGVCIALGVVTARLLVLFFAAGSGQAVGLSAGLLFRVAFASLTGSLVYIVLAIAGAITRLR